MIDLREVANTLQYLNPLPAHLGVDIILYDLINNY